MALFSCSYDVMLCIGLLVVVCDFDKFYNILLKSDQLFYLSTNPVSFRGSSGF